MYSRTPQTICLSEWSLVIDLRRNVWWFCNSELSSVLWERNAFSVTKHDEYYFGNENAISVEQGIVNHLHDHDYCCALVRVTNGRVAIEGMTFPRSRSIMA